MEASPPWGIEREGLRIFTNAIMDPDPRYWDDEFAKTTKFGGIITPPIYCSYIGRKTLAGVEDPITRAFRENPESDGIGGVREGGADRKGALPPIPTPLKRILNAGNEIELYKYPTLGDHIFSQARYSDIKGRVTKDGVADAGRHDRDDLHQPGRRRAVHPAPVGHPPLGRAAPEGM